ncbi:hypothetical protein [Actinomycetospora flava]|uniref:Uncharacterized protein n=1 Tax=Actinomycetospora flava TaxID=3129232 RepID=A0ABU8M5W0_9PSEU
MISEDTSFSSPALGSSESDDEEAEEIVDAGIAIGLTEETPPTAWRAGAGWCCAARANEAVAASGVAGASASAVCVSSVWIAGRTAPAATAATRIEPVVEEEREDRVFRGSVRVPLRENGTVSGSPTPCRLNRHLLVVGNR